jgi:hypothetical protein
MVISNSASTGGGTDLCIVDDCLLLDNRAGSGGGADYGSMLNNCTIVSNTASAGGGVFASVLTNCVVYYNLAPSGPNYYSGTLLDHCCTMPAASGAGNITNVPLFVDSATGNLRLQSNSPCINAGTNAAVAATADLDGRTRIVDGTVDIGAYEYQGPGTSEFIGWLQQFDLPTDGAADYADPDRDRMNNWQEWRADTIPTNALSALKMLSPTKSATGVTVSWESVNTRSYWLERASDLATPPTFSPIATSLPGQTGSTTYTDTNAVGPGPFFYRVGVQP